MAYSFGIFLFFMLIIDDGNSSHFRGGTISWKPIHGQTVEFKYKMGWTFGSGPGCSEKKIGQFVNETFIGDKDWKCAQGCKINLQKVGTAYYYCTAASQAENWEQGENAFQFIFTGNGPFNISYTGAMWMPLDFGNPNGWILQTTVDLRIRDDINSTNSSPITASKPLYTLQFSCYHELRLPMFDPDGDLVKCRWARGEECDSVCRAVPSAVLDEDTCTLKFNASHGGNYTLNGWYAVALTIEDFPRKTIHVGSETYTPTKALTTVPLQFLIHLVGKKTPCNWNPEFVSPTPAEGTKISIPAGQTFSLKIYAANLKNTNERVTKLSLTRPAGMTFTGPTNDPKRNGYVYWELSWTPKSNDQGSHIVCGMAEDNTGHKSGTRCITLMAWDMPDPCSKTKCPGNQTCSRIGSTQKVECVCAPGSKASGQLCLVVLTTTTTVATTKLPRSTTRVRTTLKPTTHAAAKTVQTTQLPKQTTLLPKRTTKKLQTLSTASITTTKGHLTTLAAKTTKQNRLTQSQPQKGHLTTLAAKTTKQNRLTQSQPQAQMTTRNPNKNTVSYKLVKFTTQRTKIGKTTHKLPINQHKKAPEHNCFKSKPVVLFITFILILLAALAAGAGFLAYNLIKRKNSIKALDKSSDNFDINSEK